ncbi:MAG TPA: pirin family protein [Polyangiaceae bacterium]|nr:pirin family protein [Polyangiaceae bacterium]
MAGGVGVAAAAVGGLELGAAREGGSTGGAWGGGGDGRPGASATTAPAANAATLGVRRAGERGVANHGWLRSRHTFSFGGYYDPSWSGFRNLRVINDDRVDPAQGFPTHPHRDMEIVSYVLEGALEHKDSMGTGSVIRPGDVQRMSAGTGVRHSEYNASRDEPVHFLQIWIMPDKTGIAPGYEQKSFPPAARAGKLVVVASKDGREGSVTVHADALLYAGVFADGERTTYEVAAGRHVWLHVAKGSVRVAGVRLEAGDAVYSRDGRGGAVTIEGDGSGEVLVFDLP